MAWLRNRCRAVPFAAPPPSLVQLCWILWRGFWAPLRELPTALRANLMVHFTCLAFTSTNKSFSHLHPSEPLRLVLMRALAGRVKAANDKCKKQIKNALLPICFKKRTNNQTNLLFPQSNAWRHSYLEDYAPTSGNKLEAWDRAGLSSNPRCLLPPISHLLIQS